VYLVAIAMSSCISKLIELVSEYADAVYELSSRRLFFDFRIGEGAGTIEGMSTRGADCW
jgi:hypothetical protein